MSSMRQYVGLDLGQSGDFTAVAVLEDGEEGYALRHLERFPLGTSYPDVVRQVVGLLGRCTRPVLVVDRTGVGRPVVDLLVEQAAAACTLLPVTITAGRTVSREPDGGLLVPKRHLVGALRGLVENRRLRVASSLPDAAVLARELRDFRVRRTDSGHEVFGAPGSGRHDDLVLAVALAAWAAEAGRGEEPR